MQSYIKKSESELKEKFELIDEVVEYNLSKIIRAMKDARLSDYHFNWNTGYGYDDAGREITEKIYASVLEKEDAIVRTQISSGTHAISLMLTGLVGPGDTIVSITGKPYDTLDATFGIRESKGFNLMKIGARYKEVDLLDGHFDIAKIEKELSLQPEFVYIQRSPGYSWRSDFSVSTMNDMILRIKDICPDTIVLLDNCYGELTEKEEPIADVLAGSLIKNPGGGIALGGGYIAGREDLIERISERLTAPGVGKEIGLTYGQTRNILQGLFMAPKVVGGAMKGALLVGDVFEKLGYKVTPKPSQSSGHIIQAIELGSKERLLKFCEGVQSSAPVNSFVKPIPAPMPGYEDEVIMAAGTFIQGSSIEMSADGPVKPPYNVYFQGGLCYEHVKIALKEILELLDHLG